MRSSAAPPSCSPRTWAVPRAAPIPSTPSGAGGRRGWRRCSSGRSRWPPTAWARPSRDLARALKPGEILLLENLRFHPEEEANDDDFARRLAGLADLYVNDAFAAAHRAHASIAAITRHLQPAAAGLLMRRELEALGRILEAPARAAGRRARRRQGLRQDRARRAPALEGRRARHRRRHGVHLPARARSRRRQVARRGRSDRDGALDAGGGAPPRRATSCCRSTPWWRPGWTARRGARCRCATSRPSRWGSTSAR